MVEEAGRIVGSAEAKSTYDFLSAHVHPTIFAIAEMLHSEVDGEVLRHEVKIEDAAYPTKLALNAVADFSGLGASSHLGCRPGLTRSTRWRRLTSRLQDALYGMSRAEGRKRVGKAPP